jgi:putative aldouronate transport system permease protein
MIQNHQVKPLEREVQHPLPDSIRGLRTRGMLPFHVLFIVVCALFIVPLAYIVSISLTSNQEIADHGYRLIPDSFNTLAYSYIFRSAKQLLSAYGVSILVTTFGTAASLLVTSMLSYALARPDNRYRRVISFFVFFTMLFNGGLVPTYILVTRYLHLKDTILVLILPYLVNAWFVLLMRSFIAALPLSLTEAAKIDGAGEFKTFFVIIIPLAKPALASLGLMIAFTYWNDWWLSLLYIDAERLSPLQYLLYRINANIAALTEQLSTIVNVNIRDIPSEPQGQDLRLHQLPDCSQPVRLRHPEGHCRRTRHRREWREDAAGPESSARGREGEAA